MYIRTHATISTCLTYFPFSSHSHFHTNFNYAFFPFRVCYMSKKILINPFSNFVAISSIKINLPPKSLRLFSLRYILRKLTRHMNDDLYMLPEHVWGLKNQPQNAFSWFWSGEKSFLTRAEISNFHFFHIREKIIEKKLFPRNFPTAWNKKWSNRQTYSEIRL